MKRELEVLTPRPDGSFAVRDLSAAMQEGRKVCTIFLSPRIHLRCFSRHPFIKNQLHHPYPVSSSPLHTADPSYFSRCYMFNFPPPASLTTSDTCRAP